MIDFSAFPIRKTNHYLWVKIPSGLAVLSLVLSFVLISRPNVSQKETGLLIFQVTVYIIIAVLSVSLLVVAVWFTRYIIIRFIKIITNGYGNYVPVYDNISLFEQFSLDNGFRFTRLAPQTKAPQSYFDGLVYKSDLDDVYLLYQVEGLYEGSSFNMYCLARAEGEMAGLSERRGMAYAHDSDGRRIEYATVLSSLSHVPKKRFGAIKVLNNKTHTLIYCNGYLTDRNLLENMFSLLQPGR